jgi:hypothetical protein
MAVHMGCRMERWGGGGGSRIEKHNQASRLVAFDAAGTTCPGTDA